jgi:hypothetical protein
MLTLQRSHSVAHRAYAPLQVDMTWSGHVHVYERTCPILYHTCLGYNPEGIPNAPVHMAIGNGGVRALIGLIGLL